MAGANVLTYLVSSKKSFVILTPGSALPVHERSLETAFDSTEKKNIFFYII
jgi:hypothetical protein